MRILSLLILGVWLIALARTITNLALVPHLRPRRPHRKSLVSVIIPARDEERSIERTVGAMLSQSWSDLEVIVVDDRSTDTTGAILERLSRQDRRLIVVSGEEPPPEWLGKPWALHQGSRRASGELLLFVDADILYEPDAVAAAVAEIDESGASMLALLPHIDMRGFWEHIIMPNLAIAAFTLLPLWIANRTRIPMLGVGGGSGNLVRRDDYLAAGGHESLKDAVIDDVALARLMRRSGRRTAAARAEEFVSVRMYHGLREIVDGFTKNSFAVFGRNYVAAGFVLLLSFVIHLMPYGLAMAGDRIAIATISVIALTRLILFRSLGYRMDNALLGHPLMSAAWAFIIVRSVWYTGIRGELHWRGRVYDARTTKFGAD